MHARDLERGVVVEARQQAGQPLGEHGLARTGRADEVEVVAAGRGDLERPLAGGLPDDVGQVRDLRAVVVLGGRVGALGRVAAAAQPARELPERAGLADVHAGDQRGLGAVALGDHDPLDTGSPGGEDGGQHAAHRPQPPVQAELGEPHDALHRGDRDDVGRAQHRHGQRQVEARADLAHVRRQQARA